MNTITIELHPDDRARLDAVIAGLQALASTPAAPAAPLPPAMMDAAFQRFLEKQAQEEKIQAAAAALNVGPADAPAPAADFPVVPDQVPWDLTAPADPAPAPAVKPVSLAEFQKAITIRCAESAETKAAVRGLVQEYATSVSAIPEEKRSEFLAKLAAI